MQRAAIRLISPALIAGILFPPLGLGGIITLVIAYFKLQRGDTAAGTKALNDAKLWIRYGLYAALVLLTIASGCVYLLGSRLIPAMGSFY